MIKVDKEGVPRIVQKVKFSPASYHFVINLFNGKEYFIDAAAFIRYPPSLWDLHVSNEQLEDAYIAAEKLGMRYD